MSNYYYFVASLPSLKLDNPGMSVEQFLLDAKYQLSKKDYNSLISAVENRQDSKTSRFVQKYTQFKTMVEKEVAHQRAIKLNLDDSAYINNGDKAAHISDKVITAINSDPLQGEKIIINLYWDYLENNVGVENCFDITYIISYALRLQILSRLTLFTTPKGEMEFNDLFNKLKTEIFK